MAMVFSYLPLAELQFTASGACVAFRGAFDHLRNSLAFFARINTLEMDVRSFSVLSGVPLKHLQLLKQVVRADFGVKARNMHRRVVVDAALAETLCEFDGVLEPRNHRPSELFETFKIKARGEPSNNFFSARSLDALVEASQSTLRELALKGCVRLSATDLL